MLRFISYVLLLTCTTIFTVSPTKADNEPKTYIVQLTLPEGQEFSHPQDCEEWYKSLLSESASISNDKPIMVHMYHHVMTCFAAKMSMHQAKVMENMKGVLSVRCERVYQLHTTHSPQFLGLHQNTGFWKTLNYGKGIIIGILDSGITPGHPSFSDEGVPPPPSRWKGKCEVAGCNNKLIGKRHFQPQTQVEDLQGHGTHTSSTAVGSPVHNANVFGNANGTAMGMAPLAHMAMYTVCYYFCHGSTILAGIDAAIEDGVDVLSLSLGTRSSEFYKDDVSIGAFSCMQKGIFVSGAAGNFGSHGSSLSNKAPWILTVGASATDRRIRTIVSLGNKKLFNGESLNQPKNFDHKLRPLVYPGVGETKDCMNGSLNHFDVKGKVVLCDGWGDAYYKSMIVKAARGVAMILANDIDSGDTISVESNVIPASAVTYAAGIHVKQYLIRPLPLGPNLAIPGILKPDIIGSGVNILAAWHESVDNTKTKATFNVVSGTSMSCPHLARIAALLKSQDPDWSPVAIKSAMMTTATILNLNRHAIVDQKDTRLLPADVFATDVGHVVPSRANDPGLVFDMQPNDYILYMYGLGYTPKHIELITKKKVSCSKSIPEAQLNYPSFAVSLKKGERKTYSRTATNVGVANSTYTIGEISVPHGIKVMLGISHKLTFKSVHDKLSHPQTCRRKHLRVGT
ncbi:hypothetical protein LXL04_029844 [Taraxacum kok-saghyz]